MKLLVNSTFLGLFLRLVLWVDFGWELKTSPNKGGDSVLRSFKALWFSLASNRFLGIPVIA